MRVGFSILLVTTILACGGGQPATAPNGETASKAAAATELDAGAIAPAPVTSTTTSNVDADVGAAPKFHADDPSGPPAPVERTGKTWPFHTWTRAEAVTFNQFRIRSEAPLRAYDEKGWSPHIVNHKRLDETLAKKAIEIVTAHEGDVSVSKCPFPRHAVVLFDEDVPVASINVCFQCGDIVLWPRWSPAPDWSTMSSAQQKAQMARNEKQLKRYEQVFPRWKKFFADDVGFSIDVAPEWTR